jgi:DNA-binding transcriptional MocR family regulator
VATDPSYFLAVQMFEDYGLSMHPVQTDRDGMRMESLETEIQLAKSAAAQWHESAVPDGRFSRYNGLIFVVPTYGNPTGATLPDMRRRRLVTLARRHNLLVVSDDVYQLLGFPGQTPPARLVSYDLAMGAANGRCHVVSNGSFSKLIGPGVRLGWLETGPELVNQLLASGVLQSSGSMNHMSSGIMAELLRSGAQTALLEELRETFSRRAAALCDALGAALPPGAAILCRPKGGFFVWVTLPKGVSASAAISLAMQGNVGALAGSEFSPSKGFGDCES